MYCIITDNENLVKRAKRFGEEVIKVEKSVVIKNKKERKYYNITDNVVNNFLNEFPNIVMSSLGTKAMKYILEHNLGCNKNLYEKVYPKIAKKFGTTQEAISSAIMGVYSKCITNMPPKYESFFDDYECSVHWEFKYSFDFVKACQEYIIKNYKSLSKEPISNSKIQEFLDSFIAVNKKSLGYKYVKYILEKQMDCRLETRKKVYNELAKKFEKHPGDIAKAITSIYNSAIKKNRYIPKKFAELYSEMKENHLSVGERSIELVQIMQRYLEEN